MRLHDDLKVLANAAPPPPDPDRLMRRARAVRHRRAVVVPAAVVAVLVLTITYLSRVDDEDPIMTLAFRLDQVSAPGGGVESPAPGSGLERTGEILLRRARFLGLKNPQARVEGDQILLDFGGGDGLDLQRLAAPGNLQVRKVIESVSDQNPVTTSSPGGGAAPSASTLDDVIAKLGPVVYGRAVALRAQGDAELLPGFEKLSPPEVALLPLTVQFYVPTISCGQIAPRTAPLDERTVVCTDIGVKMLLDRAALSGADLSDATTSLDSVTGMHEVDLRLKATSLNRWTTVSTDTADGVGCQRAGSDGHCLLAFVVDGEVRNSPEILRTLRADEASMSFGTKAEARLVAATLGPRELPPGVRIAG